MIGILFGLAIYNDVLIDIRFPRVFYKKLLDEKIELNDLQDIDSQMHKNLLFLLNYTENNLEDTLGLSFEVEVENFGEIHAIELKEGGKNIMINQENKKEYVDLYLDWKFNKSIQNFFNALYKGFYRVADKSIFKIIDSKELELIICGKEDLNFEDLEKGSICSDGYTEESLTVKHFWEVIKDFDDNLKKKFLFFLSGCDRAPVKGLTNLRLIIGRQGPDSDKLPTAHTCFNYLLLPDYQNKEKLKKLLLISIENSEGFGLMWLILLYKSIYSKLCVTNNIYYRN